MARQPTAAGMSASLPIENQQVRYARERSQCLDDRRSFAKAEKTGNVRETDAGANCDVLDFPESEGPRIVLVRGVFEQLEQNSDGDGSLVSEVHVRSGDELRHPFERALDNLRGEFALDIREPLEFFDRYLFRSLSTG